MNKEPSRIYYLYEINTRVWLRELTSRYGRRITLRDVPEAEIINLKESGFDTVWLMGVWLPSRLSREIALGDQPLLNSLRAVLPQANTLDIVSSPYSIAGYDIDNNLGGRDGISSFKKRLNQHGIRLVLDFVPNHLAIDHPWVKAKPLYFINGNKKDLKLEPGKFFTLGGISNILGYGKDPYYPAWKDVVQLNYFNPETREAMAKVLLDISGLCDGLRCDMAMLILKKIQKSIWGDRVFYHSRFKEPGLEFWEEAIPKVKRVYPDFIFIAEVYWRLEAKLLSLGFDYVYDKIFYDLLLKSNAEQIKKYIRERKRITKRMLRFVENHDEARAAEAFGPAKSKAAVLIMALSGGACLFHQGQIEGFKIKLPVQIIRQPKESPDKESLSFYKEIFSLLNTDYINSLRLEFIEGAAVWEGDATYKNFISLFDKKRNLLVVINYSPYQSQCYLPLGIAGVKTKKSIFKDLLNPVEYVRDRNEIVSKGFYLNIPAYAYHMFRISDFSSTSHSA